MSRLMRVLESDTTERALSQIAGYADELSDEAALSADDFHCLVGAIAKAVENFKAVALRSEGATRCNIANLIITLADLAARDGVMEIFKASEDQLSVPLTFLLNYGLQLRTFYYESLDSDLAAAIVSIISCDDLHLLPGVDVNKLARLFVDCTKSTTVTAEQLHQFFQLIADVTEKTEYSESERPIDFDSNLILLFNSLAHGFALLTAEQRTRSLQALQVMSEARPSLLSGITASLRYQCFKVIANDAELTTAAAGDSILLLYQLSETFDSAAISVLEQLVASYLGGVVKEGVQPSVDVITAVTCLLVDHELVAQGLSMSPRIELLMLSLQVAETDLTDEVVIEVLHALPALATEIDAIPEAHQLSFNQQFNALISRHLRSESIQVVSILDSVEMLQQHAGFRLNVTNADIILPLARLHGRERLAPCRAAGAAAACRLMPPPSPKAFDLELVGGVASVAIPPMMR
ncbi:MAG: hypothetical protein P1U40_08515 [Coxiellaceae bacterium]|nr:hypothetical protein [Coxiellaceae bacterium]